MDWEEEYKEMVLKAKDSFDNINTLIRHHLPKFLYKYSGCNSTYWKDRLYKGELYFCPSSKLNDIFDGSSKIDLNIALREGTQLNQIIKQRLSMNNGEKLELSNEQKEEVLCGLRKDIRIASLSEINDSASMWDRYADQHKGFCIEYDVAKMSDLKKNFLFKVIYGEKPDITKQVENSYDSAGLASIVFKDSEWKSEEEWRMFKILQNENEEKKYYFRKEIKAVYLGLKCDEKDKNIIMAWARKENKEVYQMNSNYETQKLFFEKLI